MEKVRSQDSDPNNDGSWSFAHYGPSNKNTMGIDNNGYSYSERLYLGDGVGKEKRINLEGGVYFFKSKTKIVFKKLLPRTFTIMILRMCLMLMWKSIIHVHL